MNKKKILISIILTVILAIPAFATSVLCPPEVKGAISKYKNGDYIGCIQDLTDYTEDDPTNAIAYYYMGIAYMKVGLKDNAIDSLQKVSTINTVPKLSSYAIQATRCMQNDIDPCEYKNVPETQIDKLIKDPEGFFAALLEKNGEQEEVSENDIEEDLKKLIHGDYPSNIHPDANRVIQETRLIQEQERVNSELKKKLGNTKKKSSTDTKTSEKIASANPSDKEIADAVRTLSKAGYKFSAPSSEQTKTSTEQSKETSRQQYQNMAQQYALNDDWEQMAMMFGNNNRSRQNDDWAMLNFMMNQKNPDGTPVKMNPELVKTMMMSQMMGDYDFMNNDKDK